MTTFFRDRAAAVPPRLPDWFSSRPALLALLMLATLLSACVQEGQRRTLAENPPPAITVKAGCCQTLERYPKWLIRVLEPAAPVVGNAIARVRWRKGYLSSQPDGVARLKAVLRPLDIIIVGNKGRLSGHTLPGLFTHGAVYLGGEKELRRLGLSSDPAVLAYRDAIRNGRTVIETDQRGAHLIAPETVLSADKVAILRPRLQCRAARRKVTQAFFKHLGEKFDFHFDAGENRNLFCVEMIDHVMTGLHFPRRPIYGRKTIVPDDILMQAASGRLPLDVVLYVRAGQGRWEATNGAALAADIDAYWRK